MLLCNECVHRPQEDYKQSPKHPLRSRTRNNLSRNNLSRSRRGNPFGAIKRDCSTSVLAADFRAAGCIGDGRRVLSDRCVELVGGFGLADFLAVRGGMEDESMFSSGGLGLGLLLAARAIGDDFLKCCFFLDFVGFLLRRCVFQLLVFDLLSCEMEGGLRGRKTGIAPIYCNF